MKKLLATWLFCISVFIGCCELQDISTVNPKSGKFEIAARGSTGYTSRRALVDLELQ